MKFITEEDLRDLYKRQPFTNYDLQPGERLTPGARQFLVDRGIDMYDRNDPFTGKKESAVKTEEPDPGSIGRTEEEKVLQQSEIAAGTVSAYRGGTPPKRCVYGAAGDGALPAVFTLRKSPGRNLQRWKSDL